MIKYLAKFVSKKSYADDLLNGKLYMNTPCYYRHLDNGQGDLREATLFMDCCVYQNYLIPIYCMYMICDKEIQNGQHIISTRCISDFKCENGYIVLFDFIDFTSRLYTVNTYGYELNASPVTYCIPTPKESIEMLKKDPYQNIKIKNPYFSYQKEFRIIIGKKTSSNDNDFENPKSAEYWFKEPLIDIGKSIEISSLSRLGNDYILDNL